jgi:hypothetical protein
MSPKKLLVTCVALIAGLGLVAPAAQAAPNSNKANVSILHAIPAGKGADVVDVYADNVRLLNNLTPGQLRTVKVRPGSYDIGVYADGSTPESGEPLLSIDNARFLAGTCTTITANLDASGAPATNKFADCAARNPVGVGRLTVRHIAAAPAVDFRANGEVLFGNLTNGASATKQVPAANYAITVTLASNDGVVLGPATVNAVRPFNTIVYAWGSATDGTLALAFQRVNAK